jgi:hypothetical protein
METEKNIFIVDSGMISAFQFRLFSLPVTSQKTWLKLQDYNFTRCFVWLWGLVPRTNVRK